MLRPAILRLLSAMLSFALVPVASAQTTASQSGLAEEPCRLLHELLPAAFGNCSTLEVPVNYDDPDGPRIGLFMARVPALTAEPAPDPLVLINGGPGGSAVDLYLQLRAAFEPIRRQRDILLLDQRGTGRSLSGLDCDIDEDFDLVTASTDEVRVAVETCIGQFDHDPRFFTTTVAVRDLDTLRSSLGIDSWNLYGVSYGTRVGQHYLRRYGAHVRSMILDGVVPAELPLGPAIAGDAQSALDAIFARCMDSAGCAERFAGLPEQFGELQQRFSNDSIEVGINDPDTGMPESIELELSHLQGVVRLMSYSDATVSLLPLVIDQAFIGNYLPLAAQAKLQIDSVTESLGFAMHNSVVCTEDAPWFPDDASSGTAAYLGTTVVDGLRAICEIWPAGVIDPDFKDPVASDRPVLVLSGEHDPVTPPGYGQQVIDAGLGNSQHIVGRSQGHGLVSVGCVPRLIESFIESADSQDGPFPLDTECLEREPPMPFFLSFQGPSP